ncbi:hypothetical protein F503_03903 [Ophiostoma piceae UAMH 11346]|uniref:Cnl2 nkp2 family protein n=1 Tax=Ophiostoma piceae (strain UAMH 11346) TaxID=1262450 RepID=S3CG93_OPHP1|nr:hypothetical protein F503_03903 [Ophiostoma piceae UAMH 11346]
MAPSETSILEQFLLAPAQLPTFLSLEDFAALFRTKAVSKSSAKDKAIHPSIRALYRDLQRQRGAVVDSVAADIEDEVARGRLLRRYALRERLRADAQEDAAADDELQIELLLRKEDASSKRNNDSLMSTVSGLGSAVEDLEAEVRLLEEEEAQLLQTVQQAVGSLSDLRYGRLANPQLRDQVLEGLDNVQATCNNVTASSQRAS